MTPTLFVIIKTNEQFNFAPSFKKKLKSYGMESLMTGLIGCYLDIK